MAPVVNGIPRFEVCNFNVPLALVVVPFSMRDQLFEPAVFAKTVFLGETKEVFLDLIGARIGGGPIGVGFEGPDVRMCCNIAGAAMDTR